MSETIENPNAGGDSLQPVGSVACPNNVRIIVDGNFLEIEAMRSGERLVAVVGDRERHMIIERLKACMTIKPPNIVLGEVTPEANPPK